MTSRGFGLSLAGATAAVLLTIAGVHHRNDGDEGNDSTHPETAREAGATRTSQLLSSAELHARTEVRADETQATDTDTEDSPVTSAPARARVKGSLLLTLRGARESWFEAESGAADGTVALTLDPIDFGVAPLFFPLERPGRTSITDLPAGRYVARLERGNDPLGLSNADGESIEIVDGMETPLVLDLSDLGALVLEIHGPGGTPYTGSVRFLLSHSPPSGLVDGTLELLHGYELSLRRPPYIVGFLEPGEYGLQLLHPGQNTGGDRVHPVQVLAGTDTVQEFWIQD